MKTLNHFLFFMILSLPLIAQTGSIRGTIYDENTGETILFANVIIEGTRFGGTSDLDGTYSIDIEPGTYTLSISYIGYADFKIESIQVIAGEIQKIDIALGQASEIIQEVVISANQLRNTENALMTIQRKSPNVIDGISSQSFRSIGDSNAGEAIKRVTGVSVQGGKHVFVRGLGDRYTKTIFNGMDLPGLDPDRNSVEMDIFPTNIIDNIVVYKSFSPNLPGDFTGGIVNVTTKDFPEEQIFGGTIGASYNPVMNMNPNFLGYQGGSTDIFGMDDGTRALPFSGKQIIPDISNTDKNSLIPYLTSQLTPTMAAQKTTSGINKNFSLSYGNRAQLGKITIGILAAANYRQAFTYNENALFQEFTLRNDQFFINRKSEGQIAQSDVFWNALAGVSFKLKSHRVNFQYLHLQNGLSTASKLEQRDFEANPAIIIRDNLEYTERSVNNYILNGKHNFMGGNLELEWKVMPTIAAVDEPDIRVTGFEKVTNSSDGSISYEIRPAVGADINRTWRNLHETNLNSKIDLNYRFNIGERSSKLSVGALNNRKERDFAVYNYIFRVSQQTQLNLDGNADKLFSESNIWTPESNAGTYIRGNFEPANTYNSRQGIWAAYILNELPINTRFKAIYGLRAEHASIFYSGQSNDGQRVYNDEEVLNELDLLPSLNLVYELVENMNIRLSASKTVARPSFKEKSLAQIQDRVSGRTFLGNIDLEETKINNFDVRWEYFFNSGQMISISSFYKTFKKPIELVAFSAVAPNNFQPKNGEDTQLYGIEFEIRKELNFISPYLNGLNLSFNTTFVQSEIKIDEENVRPLVGQSPYIINGILAYNNADLGLDANLSYNVQGERLFIVGIGNVPSVYEQAFHGFNFKISKKFGITRNWSMSFSAANILNQDNYFEYKNEGEPNVLFQRLSPGRSFSFSFSWLL